VGEVWQIPKYNCRDHLPRHLCLYSSSSSMRECCCRGSPVAASNNACCQLPGNDRCSGTICMKKGIKEKKLPYTAITAIENHRLRHRVAVTTVTTVAAATAAAVAAAAAAAAAAGGAVDIISKVGGKVDETTRN